MSPTTPHTWEQAGPGGNDAFSKPIKPCYLMRMYYTACKRQGVSSASVSHACLLAHLISRALSRLIGCCGGGRREKDGSSKGKSSSWSSSATVIARWHCNHTVTSPSVRSGRDGLAAGDRDENESGDGAGNRDRNGVEMGVGIGMGLGLGLRLSLGPRLNITTEQPRMLLSHTVIMRFLSCDFGEILKEEKRKVVK